MSFKRMETNKTSFFSKLDCNKKKNLLLLMNRVGLVGVYTIKINTLNYKNPMSHVKNDCNKKCKHKKNKHK